MEIATLDVPKRAFELKPVQRIALSGGCSNATSGIFDAGRRQGERGRHVLLYPAYAGQPSGLMKTSRSSRLLRRWLVDDEPAAERHYRDSAIGTGHQNDVPPPNLNCWMTSYLPLVSGTA